MNFETTSFPSQKLLSNCSTGSFLQKKSKSKKRRDYLEEERSEI